MGNRAVITTLSKRIGIYLHWNGGKESVDAFLAYCKERGFRCPSKDEYGWASLVTTISNYFGHTGNCVGLDVYEKLDVDNGDNGVYFIENWEIVGRAFEPKGYVNYDKSTYESVLRRVREMNDMTDKESFFG